MHMYMYMYVCVYLYIYIYIYIYIYLRCRATAAGKRKREKGRRGAGTTWGIPSPTSNMCWINVWWFIVSSDARSASPALTSWALGLFPSKAVLHRLVNHSASLSCWHGRLSRSLRPSKRANKMIWYSSCTDSSVGYRIGSQMQEVWGSNPSLGGLRMNPFQVSGGISTLQSRASGLQSSTQGIPFDYLSLLLLLLLLLFIRQLLVFDKRCFNIRLEIDWSFF